MLESGDFVTKLSKNLSRFVGGMHSVQSDNLITLTIGTAEILFPQLYNVY
jgi:hypothetical protein